MGSIKGTTKSQGNKDPNDKFYTKTNIAKSLLSTLSLQDYDIIIEPSAGNGAFSSLIKDVYAYDIKPESDNIIQADWLTLDKKIFQNKGKVLVVGNPPFGNQGAMAFNFLKESMSFADTVAFILPKSYKKNSFKDRLPLDFILYNEQDIPSNSFLLNGKDYDVPCVWQEWHKSKTLRKKSIKKTKTTLFAFVDKENADFRIQRVGGNAGKAFKDTDRAIASNYFVKNTSNMTIDELINAINNLSLESKNSTVGPRSVSKTELITELEEYLERG